MIDFVETLNITKKKGAISYERYIIQHNNKFNIFNNY